MVGQPDERLARLAEIARRWARELGPMPWPAGVATEEQLIARVIADVQALPYCPESDGAVDVVETDLRRAMKRCGDCKVRSMLVCAFLVAYGVPAWIVWQVQEGAELDHVTAIVGAGERWADGTVVGARVGEEPHDAKRRVMYEGGPRPEQEWGVSV